MKNLLIKIAYKKLIVASLLMYGLFGFSAMAQDKTMEAKSLAALITELKDVVSKNSSDKNEARLIGKRWDARQDLAGKTKSQVINLLYDDVRAVIKDSGTQYQIYSIFSLYKQMPDDKSSDSNEPPDDEEFTDPRDGEVYGFKKLGNLNWMTENLRFNVRNASWCYENKSANCDALGRLYTFESALKACPAGWRLPSDNDWLDLEKALGMPQNQWRIDGYDSPRGDSIGQKLKVGGSSELEFKISGYVYVGDESPKFDGIGGTRPRSYFWTSTGENVNGETIAYRRRLEAKNGYIFRFRNPTDGYAVAVRCVQ